MNKKFLLLLIPLIILIFSCKTNDEIYYQGNLNTAMYIPVLLTPENGSTISENPPTLTWERAQYIHYFEVQVSLDDSFNNVVNNAETWKEEGPIVSCTLDSALNPTSYYWRVRSLADTGG